MAKERVFKIKADLDLETADRKALDFRATLERTFAPIQFNFPDLPNIANLVSGVNQVEDQFRNLSQIEITQPVDELREDLERVRQDIARAENELQNLTFTGGAPQQTARWTQQLSEYFDKLEAEFGREVANRARATGRIRLGDVGAEFVNDTADPEGLGRTQQAFRELQEKKRFTVEEQRRLLEIETEVHERRAQATRIEQQIARAELAEVQQWISSISDAERAGGGQELLDNALRDYQAASVRLAEEEADALRTLTNRKRQIAELDQRIEQRREPTIANERVTALTVTKQSVENAERLTAALREAAQAQSQLAEATRGNRQFDRSFEIQFEREKLELQRRNAQIIAQMQEQERIAAAQKRAQIQQELSAQLEAQRQQTTVARAAAAQQANDARAAANERTEATRQETIARAELERRATIEAAEAQRRQTAEFRQQMRERERAARSNAQAQRQLAAGVSGVFGGIDRLADLATGGLLAYGTVQAIQQIYSAAKEGAGQLRFAEVFEQQAQRVGVSSQEILKAVQEASNGTIRESQAMALAAQLLSQKWAESSGDITGDLGLLIEFSRRASQLYTDENGQLLSTQEVFSRLLKFVREGNKELVDQFGLSNQAIADFLNIPLQGLASTGGAQNRFKGLVGILGQELDRLGRASDTAADQIETSEARINDAWDRIKQTLAEPTANFLTGVASGVDNISLAFGNDSVQLARRVTEERIKAQQQLLADLNSGQTVNFGGFALDKNTVDTKNVEEAIRRYERLNRLLGDIGSNPELARFQAELLQISTDMARWGVVTDAQTQRLKEIELQAKVLADALAIVDEKTLNGNNSAGDLVLQMQALTTEYLNGGVGLIDYERQMESLRRGLLLFSGDTRQVAEDTEAMRKALADLVAEAKAAGKGLIAEILVAKGGITPDNFAAELAALEDRIGRVDELLAPIQEAKERIGSELLDAASQAIPNLGVDRAKDQLSQALAELESEFSRFSAQFAQAGTAPSAVDLEFFVTGLSERLLAQFESFDAVTAEKERIQSDLQDAAVDLVESIGVERAEEILKQQRARLDELFAGLGDNLDPTQLALKVAEIDALVNQPFEDVKIELGLSDINAEEAIGQISQLLDNLNNPVADAIPALADLRDELFGLMSEILTTGQVTDEQAQQLTDLEAATFGASNAAATYQSVIAALGADFFKNNEEANGLVGQMSQLDRAFATGAINADEYAGAMGRLLRGLEDVAGQAGVTGGAVGRAFANANNLVISGAKFGGVDFARGQQLGNSLVASNETQAEFATRQAAEREAVRAQQEAARAIERAAQKLESSAEQIPGLLGTSDVTAQDIADTKAGVYRPKADENLRRLRAEVEQGKDLFPQISIEDAQEALRRIGIETAGQAADAVLRQFERAWADSSLFANAENLSLINFDAVEENLRLQQAAEEGKQNILDYLQGTLNAGVDAITKATGAAPSGAAATATTTPVSASGTVLLTPTINIEALQAELAALEAEQLGLTVTVNAALRVTEEEQDIFRAALEASIAPEISVLLAVSEDEIERLRQQIEGAGLPGSLPGANGQQSPFPNLLSEQQLQDVPISLSVDQARLIQSLQGAITSPEINALFVGAGASSIESFAAAMEQALIENEQRFVGMGRFMSRATMQGYASESTDDSWVDVIEDRVTSRVLETLAA